jgi:hypothetical protein
MRNEKVRPDQILGLRQAETANWRCFGCLFEWTKTTKISGPLDKWFVTGDFFENFAQCPSWTPAWRTVLVQEKSSDGEGRD